MGVGEGGENPEGPWTRVARPRRDCRQSPGAGAVEGARGARAERSRSGGRSPSRSAAGSPACS
eukprot:1724268-Alexandrium_andersonii.AAC.1